MVGIVLLDQLTKAAVQQNFQLGESIEIIKGFFSFTYVQNTGAAFGLGADAHDTVRALLFLAIPVLACLFLMYMIIKALKEPLIISLAYSLIFAGAVGNLIDRFVLKFVVDFLDFYIGNSHFPAFNIADSSITIGASLLVIDALLATKNKLNASSST